MDKLVCGSHSYGKVVSMWYLDVSKTRTCTLVGVCGRGTTLTLSFGLMGVILQYY